MRENFLSGQVFGKVDWISPDCSELVTYVRTNRDVSAKCTLTGPCVQAALEQKAIKLGSVITASGEVFVRCTGGMQGNSPVTEAVVEVSRFLSEPCLTRSRGSIHVNIKGVVMWRSEDGMYLKTFFNSKAPDRPASMTCSVEMGLYLRTMSAEGREAFLQALKPGREFTLTGTGEPTGYISQGKSVPNLKVMTADFKLQG